MLLILSQPLRLMSVLKPITVMIKRDGFVVFKMYLLRYERSLHERLVRFPVAIKVRAQRVVEC